MCLILDAQLIQERFTPGQATSSLIKHLGSRYQCSPLYPYVSLSGFYSFLITTPPPRDVVACYRATFAQPAGRFLYLVT